MNEDYEDINEEITGVGHNKEGRNLRVNWLLFRLHLDDHYKGHLLGNLSYKMIKQIKDFSIPMRQRARQNMLGYDKN